MATRRTGRRRRGGSSKKFGLLSIGAMMGAFVSVMIISILPFSNNLKGLFSTVIVYGLLAKTVPGLRGLFGALITISVLQALFNLGGNQSGTTTTQAYSMSPQALPLAQASA